MILLELCKTHVIKDHHAVVEFASCLWIALGRRFHDGKNRVPNFGEGMKCSKTAISIPVVACGAGENTLRSAVLS